MTIMEKLEYDLTSHFGHVSDYTRVDVQKIRQFYISESDSHVIYMVNIILTSG